MIGVSCCLLFEVAALFAAPRFLLSCMLPCRCYVLVLIVCDLRRCSRLFAGCVCYMLLSVVGICSLGDVVVCCLLTVGVCCLLFAVWFLASVCVLLRVVIC